MHEKGRVLILNGKCQWIMIKGKIYTDNKKGKHNKGKQGQKENSVKRS